MRHYRRNISAASTCSVSSRCAPSVGGDRLVAHVENVELLDAAWSLERDGIAFARLDQRSGHRRHPADITTRRIDLVDAHDAHSARLAARGAHGHCRAEEDLVRIVGL